MRSRRPLSRETASNSTHITSMNEADLKLAGNILGIKLKPKHIERFWRHVTKLNDDECWEWQLGLSVTGYGKMKIRPKTMATHRFSFVIHNLYSPEMVLHSCDNRKCVNPKHLRAGNHIENMADMTARNRQATGMRHGFTKITDEQVLELRSMYAAGVKMKAIAIHFGINKGSVANIACGRCWRHLPNAQPVRRPNSGQWRKKLRDSQI